MRNREFEVELSELKNILSDRETRDERIGAATALTGKINVDIKKVRDEMLSTTATDLKQFSGLINELQHKKNFCRFKQKSGG